MPVLNIPASALAALNDNELEILRLLASGHTVKSIASGLGRSETAVNERLRDARRKTGVGSSRELARLLDTQKIWDKNFDLSKPGPAADTLEQPRSEGFQLSKGTIAMFFALPVAALGLAIVAGTSMHEAKPAQAVEAAPVEAASVEQSPLVGRWSLDVERIPAEERPHQVTIDFRVSPNNDWTTRVVIVGADGATRYAESTAAPNGVAVPVTGNMGFIDTGSLRQPSPDTLVMTLAKDGSPVSTRVYTVAKDGMSMTETIIWAVDGVPKLETTYFEKIG